MAGHHAHRTKLVRLVVLFVFCLTVGLVRRFQLLHTPLHHERFQPGLNPTAHHNRIPGRWEAVRTSLGLTPLPHVVLVPPDPVSPSHPDKRASRFDLGSKRRAEEATRRLPPLHFAPDIPLAQPVEATRTRPDRKPKTSPTQEKDANVVSFSVLAAS